MGRVKSEFLVVSAARWSEYSRMHARQEEECHELSKAIKYVSEGQGKLLRMMERKSNLMSEAREDLRKQIPRNLESKRILEDLLKEGRNAEVEEGRVTVTAGGGVTTRQTVTTFRSRV